MTLTLTIENFDKLEDGGPVSFSVTEAGASIGRRRSMDWVLPDPVRHISGHHFDISWAEGGYWLTDVSTNGTFLQGRRHRLEGPYRLSDGERLTVGQYIILVQIGAAAVPAAPRPVAEAAPPLSAPLQSPAAWQAQAPASDHDPWDFGAEALEPVNPLPTPAANPHHLDDVARDFVPLQQPGGGMGGVPSGLQSPGVVPGGGGMSPGLGLSMPPASFAGGYGGVQQPGQQAGHGAIPGYGAPQVPGGPPPSPSNAISHGLSLPPLAPAGGPAAVPMPSPGPAPMQPHVPLSAPQPHAMPYGGFGAQQAPVAPVSTEGAALVRAFCEGAGLNPATGQGVDPERLARDLGRAMRIATEEVMRMLRDRANVKQFTRGGERTMRSATGNNPMKFLPDTDQALEALFLRHRDGFMTGPDGFENALKDLRLHQLAVFAALQPALASVLEGLSPEEIERSTETTGSKMLGGRRGGRGWETYVERWDAKAEAGEHGMLDAFLAAFARAYAKVTMEQGGSQF